MSKISETIEDFPVWALQPRAETGATAFLNKYPTFDGRGTVIAIFDSGVDPGAGGLQVTSDGKPKVIERIDASGAGDIDMSKVVECNDGKIVGLTGRVLNIPQEWTNSNVKGKSFRVGCKRIFGLYPKILREQVHKQRLDRIWNPGHKKNLAKITNDIEDFEAKKSGETVTGKDKLVKDNLDASLDLLMQMDKKMQTNNGLSSSLSGLEADVGPTFDVISFYDGTDWQIVIDNTDDGNLAHALKLRPFSVAQEFASLTKDDNLNVSVNVYDDGNVVELVSICSSHGTHVASIAAANFPDAPEKNGVAPGAQIISVTIGDGRLGSMETGSALVRAMTYVMQRKENGLPIDVINMSYGEHSQWSNSGKIGEMIGDVVNKYGIVWAVSAGNAGPALCTIGTPPDIATNTMIGVGAYVSPEMMMAMYSSREKLPGNTYTWTSRGPSIDGDRGVTICAPGGAITSVPKFTNRGSQLMNGTSMACPHTAGALSLLLSGLKQKSLNFTPFSIKRSLMTSAKRLSHVCHFAQGHGLLQIEGAFEHLTQYHNSPDRDVRFSVTCSNSHKGIHLRDFYEDKAVEIPIKVEPFFLDNDKRSNDDKVAFNLRFSLACSAPWVKHPKHLDLMFSARHFLVQVDPTGLEPGVHAAYVSAYDAQQPDKGALFEIPITVVRPEPLMNEPRPHVEHCNVTFAPGDIKRHFVKAPSGATWAQVKVVSEEKSATGKFVLHTVQLGPNKSVMQNNHEKMFSLSENGEWSYGFSVTGGHVLEVCLAKWWANIGIIKASYSVTFYGIEPSSKEIVFHGADGITRLDLKSSLHSEEVQAEGKLKHSVQNFRPSDSKTVVLAERYKIPNERSIFELQLTYNFNVNKASEITPNLSLLSEVLYESEFISQFWVLYNSHKQFVSCGDAYAPKWTAKVDKDDYTLKVYVRHEKRDILDKLSDLPMTLSTKLSTPVSLDIYASHAQASLGSGKKSTVVNVAKGASIPLYITAPNVNEKHTKHAGQGQYLQGTVTFSKDDLGRKADVYPVRYILNEPAVKKDKSKTNGKKGDGSLAESIAEQKVSWVGKLDPLSDEATKLFDSLKKDEVAHQGQLRLARITAFALERKNLETVDKKAAKEVVDLAAEIQDLIKEDDLLLFYGTKYDSRVEAADIKKDMEKNRNILIEALGKKGMAQCALGNLEEATEILFKLLKFTDITDSKIVAFAVVHAEQMQHYARAIKLVQSQLEAKPNSVELEQKLITFYDKLGWEHCSKMATETFPTRFPPDFELH